MTNQSTNKIIPKQHDASGDAIATDVDELNDVKDDEDIISNNNISKSNSNSGGGGMIRGMIRSWTNNWTTASLQVQEMASSASSMAAESSSSTISSSIINQTQQSLSDTATSTSGATVTFLDKQNVANVSDRISTGLDWYQTAIDTDTTSNTNTSSSSSFSSLLTSSSLSETTTRTTPDHHTNNIQQMNYNKYPIYRKLVSLSLYYYDTMILLSGTIIKNTILGGILFESYGYIISSLISQQNNNSLLSALSIPPPIWMMMYTSPSPIVADASTTITTTSSMIDNDYHDHLVHDNVNTNGVLIDDDYMKVSILGHYIAGMISGSIHGIMSNIFDMIHMMHQTIIQQQQHLNNNITKKLKPFSLSPKQLLLLLVSSSNMFSLYTILYHSISHSILFGSYEYWKRTLLSYNNIFIPSTYSSNHSPPAKTNHRHFIDNSSLPILATTTSSSSTLLIHHNEYNYDPHIRQHENEHDHHDIEHDHRNHSHGNNNKKIETYESFIAIGIAGGIAGQIQHIISHYMEPQERPISSSSSQRRPSPQHLLLFPLVQPNTDHSILLKSLKRIHNRRRSTYDIIPQKVENMFKMKLISINKNMTTCYVLLSYMQRHYNRQWKKNRIRIFTKILSSSSSIPPPPTLRSILYAFPPSAIGFIAFEYGKHAI